MDNTASNWTFTGSVSGTTITGTHGSDTAATFTIGAGAATVSTDASAPSYTIASALSTGVTNVVLKLRASNEDVSLTKLGLQLTNSASSSASDLVKVSVYDGATKVGDAFFISGASVATSTFSTPVTLTKNADKILTIKADYANIGTGEAVTFSGHLVAVDFKNAEGVGAQSGVTVFPSGSSASNGTRVMKSFPVFATDSSLSSAGVNDGRLMRFKITADAAGPVSITQFGVNIATSSGVGVTNLTIYGFTDSSYSTPISGVSSSGDLQSTDDWATASAVPGTGNATIGITTSGGTASTIQVPAGATRYFEVRGSVSGIVSGSSISTKILGASAFPSTSAGVSANPLLAAGNASFVTTGGLAADFIWAPNSTTTAGRNDQDWTNGFGVIGLPSGGLIFTRSQ